MRMLVVPFALLAYSLSTQAARWDSASNPHKFARVTGKAFVTEFAALPLAAKLTNPHFIWSDTYWPSNLGGIAYRWNNEPNPEPFRYKLLSKTELSRLSANELAKLSPAEKYDVFMGQYDYPLTRKVLSLYDPRNLWWEGICHGWSLASVNHPEPARVNLPNRDGITVPFGSQDVKGLLDFYYAYDHKTKVRAQVGRRCRINGKVPGEAYPEDRVQTMPMPLLANSKDCADVNAGAFHLSLANMIGLQDRGFVAEVDRFNDVWNQPVGEYSSQVVSERPATRREARRGIGQVIQIKTAMTYGEELNLLAPEWAGEEGGYLSMDPVTGTSDQTFSTRHYEYTVELNNLGQIVGGEWISQTRPDFLWLKAPAQVFQGRLSGLNQIYRPVID